MALDVRHDLCIAALDALLLGAARNMVVRLRLFFNLSSL